MFFMKADMQTYGLENLQIRIVFICVIKIKCLFYLQHTILVTLGQRLLCRHILIVRSF